MIEIRYDDRQLKVLERTLRGIPRAMPQVMSRGLNRTATQARTRSARFLSKETGIKVGDVRKRLSMRKATYSRWQSGVYPSRKRLSLQYLNPRQTSRGLSVKSGRKRVTIRHAFPALKGWFIRLPEGGGYTMTLGVEQASEIDQMAKVGRLPIGRIRGPILAQVFASAGSEVNRIQAESVKLLQKNIHDQVQLILKRRAG